ncbi:DUF262 domain-containing protein [Pseudomonas aeruginosa]|uniref:DUF262 domain-containing protein n=1 Tax=Pseudomonas aeruginosa TaxID=287 RepID=UPI001495A73C|nr:DUF262 domain-containing protein [Pseudomonas aeruginosa]NPT27035.1 DUF262 domain-containing protein [Pseudomonas aeruginosa]
MADTDFEIEDNIEVLDMDEQGDDEGSSSSDTISPDEFFSKHAFRVVYQTNNFLLPQLRDLVSKGEVLNLRPEYQRRLRWSNTQKSRLIESLLLNIPIPPVFLYENDGARYEVMDGQQRLNAIKEFQEGEFPLTGLEVLSPLNGLRYSKTPPRIKRALDRATVSAIVLLFESDSERSPDNKFTITDVRRFVFDRLNTGGTKLNAQEIRNAIYPGEFNKLIVNLARGRVFTDIFGIPPYIESEPSDYYENPNRQKNKLYASMGDCQLVLRYFALRDEENIRGSMKSMLDRAMASRVKITEESAAKLGEEFNQALNAAVEIFGPKPFLLPEDDKGRRRISSALYDASMVAICRQMEHLPKLMEQSGNIKKRLDQEFASGDKDGILTGQGNTAKTVKQRIELLEKIIREGAGLI